MVQNSNTICIQRDRLFTASRESKGILRLPVISVGRSELSGDRNTHLYTAYQGPLGLAVLQYTIV